LKIIFTLFTNSPWLQTCLLVNRWKTNLFFLFLSSSFTSNFCHTFSLTHNVPSSLFLTLSLSLSLTHIPLSFSTPLLFSWFYHISSNSVSLSLFTLFSLFRSICFYLCLFLFIFYFLIYFFVKCNLFKILNFNIFVLIFQFFCLSLLFISEVSHRSYFFRILDVTKSFTISNFFVTDPIKNKEIEFAKHFLIFAFGRKGPFK